MSVWSGLTVTELSLKVSGWMKECVLMLVLCGVVVLVSVLFRVGGGRGRGAADSSRPVRTDETLLQQQQL